MQESSVLLVLSLNHNYQNISLNTAWTGSKFVFDFSNSQKLVQYFSFQLFSSLVLNVEAVLAINLFLCGIGIWQTLY